MPRADDESQLLHECHERAIGVLKRNSTPVGMRAAAPTERAKKRGYTAIFGRDAAICALGMALSGDPALERAALDGSRHAGRAPGAERPDSEVRRLRRGTRRTSGTSAASTPRCGGSSRSRCSTTARRQQIGRAACSAVSARVERALHWLGAQEHQRFFLLQQNEASDWADIMPRSGFVLYTNALWYLVKRLFALAERGGETREQLQPAVPSVLGARSPNTAARACSAHYVCSRARNRDLYLSFVNFASCGDEGDVFGNVLAILVRSARADGASPDASTRCARAACTSHIRCAPSATRSRKQSALWRPYMARHRQNFAWQYHNGGIWPFVGGFWVAALARAGGRRVRARELVKLARANALDDWAFNEWLHGRTLGADAACRASRGTPRRFCSQSTPLPRRKRSSARVPRPRLLAGHARLRHGCRNRSKASVPK